MRLGGCLGVLILTTLYPVATNGVWPKWMSQHATEKSTKVQMGPLVKMPPIPAVVNGPGWRGEVEIDPNLKYFDPMAPMPAQFMRRPQIPRAGIPSWGSLVPPPPLISARTNPNYFRFKSLRGYGENATNSGAGATKSENAGEEPSGKKNVTTDEIINKSGLGIVNLEHSDANTFEHNNTNTLEYDDANTADKHSPFSSANTTKSLLED
ncbi:hypothetical protein AAMO2058_000437800 [Amorphochlora amoebiformis]